MLSKILSISPKKLPSPEKRFAEDTYFDRVKNGLGHFVDVLDKLRRFTKHTNGIPIVVNAHDNEVEEIRLYAL